MAHSVGQQAIGRALATAGFADLGRPTWHFQSGAGHAARGKFSWIAAFAGASTGVRVKLRWRSRHLRRVQAAANSSTYPTYLWNPGAIEAGSLSHRAALILNCISKGSGEMHDMRRRSSNSNRSIMAAPQLIPPPRPAPSGKARVFATHRRALRRAHRPANRRGRGLE
jgi:hypothetical protein